MSEKITPDTGGIFDVGERTGEGEKGEWGG